MTPRGPLPADPTQAAWLSFLDAEHGKARHVPALADLRLLDGDTTPPAPRPQRPPEEAEDAVWGRALVRPVERRWWLVRLGWMALAVALLCALAVVVGLFAAHLGERLGEVRATAAMLSMRT